MKKIQFFFLFLFMSINMLCVNIAHGEERLLSGDSTDVEFAMAFSPNKAAKELILGNINDAKKSILMAAYSFTSKDIAKALLNAHKRGVIVRIIVDDKSSRAKYSAVTFLANLGVAVRRNGNYAIFHNKFMVIDERDVETGSYNYSVAAAKKNAENVLFVKNAPAVAKQYTEEWCRLWEESIPIEPNY